MVSLQQYENENAVTMLKAGMVFSKILSCEPEPFKYGGQNVKSAKITAILAGETEIKEFHTTSDVVISKLEKVFSMYEDLDSVKIQETRSKRDKTKTYLELVPA